MVMVDCMMISLVDSFVPLDELVQDGEVIVGNSHRPLRIFAGYMLASIALAHTQLLSGAFFVR